jgi:proteasome activator subunit 4
MVAHLEPLSSGFPLTDINDDRYQYITSLRRRFGQFLHRASGSLLQQGEQNTLDAVMTLVCSNPIYSIRTANYVSLKIRSVRTYMLEYGDSRDRLIALCYPNSAFLLIV